MKNMPWQDIIPLKKWEKSLNRYKNGQMDSIAKTRGQRIGHFFTGTFTLPKTVLTLDLQIRHYHNIEKRSVANLKTRAGMLRMIAATGQMFLTRHKLAPTLKTDIKDQIRKKIMRPQISNEIRQQVDKDLGGVTNEMERKMISGEVDVEQWKREKFNSYMQQKYEDEYETYKDASFDYAISKLVRRARRKSEYIEKLIQHLDNADRGFTGREELLEYIKSKSEGPDNNDLVGIKSHEILEKVDPWHRPIEIKIHNKTHLPVGGGPTVHGHAFVEWMRDESQDLPFFVWLEGHYICTDRDAHVDDVGTPDYPTGHVSYSRSDQELGGKIRLISVRNGMLWAYWETNEQTLDIDLFDTSDAGAIPGKGKLHNAYAYVWSKEGFIFAGIHQQSEFHHSSIVSGKKVRCAGMIGAVDGKIRWLDNSSGHYMPGSHHLRKFVEFLSIRNAFATDALVADESIKPKNGVQNVPNQLKTQIDKLKKGVPWREYLNVNWDDEGNWRPQAPSKRPWKT
ncbi:MAG: hypothetical protein ACYTBJ_02595 [Planctomycetota bacterium]|jgi:hypothetical protein